jgi:hypothetical protein
MKPLLAPGEQVDMWTLRAMSIAARRSPADVPDNRPLSDGSADRGGTMALM